MLKTADLDVYDKSGGTDLESGRSTTVETGGVAPHCLTVACDDLTLCVVLKREGKTHVLLYDITSFQVLIDAYNLCAV